MTLMRNAKETQKYWKEMQVQEKQFPHAHIYTNIRNMGVNMDEMSQKNPYLFEMFTRIFSGIGTSETIQTWKNYEQAYKELFDAGLLNFRSLRNQIMKKKIDEFVSKVNGTYLIPLSELEKVITEEKRKGEISLQVDFNDFLDLLEKYYEIEHRDFFQRFGKDKPDYASLLNLTKEEYKKHSNFSPSQDLIATKIVVLQDKYETVNGMPYVDFWHHWMDNDFAEVSNGSIEYLWADTKETDVVEEGIKIPAILYQKMREVMFKEISQHPYYQGKKPDEIKFYIYW